MISSIINAGSLSEEVLDFVVGFKTSSALGGGLC